MTVFTSALRDRFAGRLDSKYRVGLSRLWAIRSTTILPGASDHLVLHAPARPQSAPTKIAVQTDAPDQHPTFAVIEPVRGLDDAS
ncbi:hypothetical protein, partial [Xanthomonas theicola]|uniref:hypothetical protein n=1 Tax=Xanthomonas theicola TaxID=56464 RepID=UPI0011B0CFB4